MTALLLLAPARRCFFKDRNSAPPARSSSSPITARILTEQVHRAAASFLRNSGAWPLRKCRSALPIPPIPPRLSAANWIMASARTHREIYASASRFAALRREDPVFRAQRQRGMDGAVLSPEAFLLRFFGEHGRPAVAGEPGRGSASGSRARASAGSSGRLPNGLCCGRAKIPSMAALARRRSISRRKLANSRPCRCGSETQPTNV